MGLFSGLKNFLGGESKTTPYQQNIYSPEQQKLLKLLSGRAQAGLEGDVPGSPSAHIPMTGGEQSYMDWTRGDLLSGMAEGKVPYDTGQTYIDQYMEAYKPIWERARGEAMDLARSEYAGPTYWGGARAEGMSDIASQWGEKLAMTEGQLMMDEEQRRRTAIDKYQGMALQAGDELQQAGALERGVEESRVSDMLNRFLRGEQVIGEGGEQYQDPVYNQNIQLALALLGYSPYSYGSQEKTEGPGLGYGMLTGFAQGAGSSL